MNSNETPQIPKDQPEQNDAAAEGVAAEAAWVSSEEVYEGSIDGGDEKVASGQEETTAPATESKPKPAQDEGLPPEPQPLYEMVADRQAELKRVSKIFSTMAAVLGPLAKESTYVDAKKALGVVAKASAKLPTEMENRSDGGELLELIKGRLEERIALAAKALGEDLALHCKARGLKMRVISKDGPIDLRIAPFGIVIDRTKGQAVIKFAREVLEKTPAEADAIMVGYDAAYRQLDGPFDADEFHRHCLRGWQAARAATGARTERVEITDFLPYLALQRQEKKFFRDPRQKTFRDYTRVQFAWDVLRLRQARKFVVDGWRLNIGAASGTSATDKKRVIFMEDENGQGEYKLTVYFVREETE